MTLAERRTAVDVESVRLYLYRQTLELQRQQNAQEIGRVERELVLLDGQADVLDALINDATKASV